jgi:transposase-like protein
LELRERAVRLYLESVVVRSAARRASSALPRRAGGADAARKENAELRRANAILKDASVLFAQELDPTRRR